MRIRLRLDVVFLAALAALILGGGTALAAASPNPGHGKPSPVPSQSLEPAVSPSPEESPESSPSPEASESPEAADSPEPAESPDGGDGGSVARFHDAATCSLVDTSKLPANWTHGDYVSAVAQQHPGEVRQAAHSPCGKPLHAHGAGG